MPGTVLASVVMLSPFMWVQRWGEVVVTVIGQVVTGDCPEMAVACAD